MNTPSIMIFLISTAALCTAIILTCAIVVIKSSEKRYAMKQLRVKRDFGAIHIILSNILWLAGPAGLFIFGITIAATNFSAAATCMIASLGLQWPCGNYLDKAWDVS